MLGEDGPQLIGRGGASLDQGGSCPDQGGQLPGGLRQGFHPPQLVPVGAGVVGEHEGIRGVGLRAGCAPPRTCGLEACRLDHQHGMARPGDQADDQTFTPFDGDRDLRRIAQLGEVGKQCCELGVGVVDHPGLDRRAVVIEEAHPVNR